MLPGLGGSNTIGRPQWTLAAILDNPDAFDSEINPINEEKTVAEAGVAEGYCVECEDQPADIRCEDCRDNYCDLCFEVQHRKGTRKLHTTRPLASRFGEQAKYIPLRLTLPERKLLRLLESVLQVSEYTDRVDIVSYTSTPIGRAAAQIRELCAILSGLCLAADYKTGQELFEGRDFAACEGWFARVFEIGRRYKMLNPDKMREAYCNLIHTLMDARSPDIQQLLGFSPVVPIVTVHSTLAKHGALAILEDPRLETATREIISPPGATGRVRAEVQRSIKEKERAVEALVNEYAASEGSPSKLRAARRAEREAAAAAESANGPTTNGAATNGKHGTNGEEAVTPISADLLRQCIYSIGDNSAFLRVNRDPCEIMIGYLRKYFHPTKFTPTETLEEAAKVEQPSLAISNGRNGARLSHDHSKQYAYVLQSLTLWKDILGDMFHLWTLAESDLLSTITPYSLQDTGQGLNRVQLAPKTSREMNAILSRAQRALGGWVGSSVIQMGDHNVPNALFFIEKYSQVSRILLPITNVLSHIISDARVREYAIREWGGAEEAVRLVLIDFFRSGFDGSGADSYFNAGSCIDGRLTSAWNWCSLLEKKPYFPLFLLSGFVGFDGHW